MPSRNFLSEYDCDSDSDFDADSGKENASIIPAHAKKTTTLSSRVISTAEVICALFGLSIASWGMPAFRRFDQP